MTNKRNTLNNVEEVEAVEKDQPWERQPCDTDDSWVAFCAYRDSSPPRKLFARKGMQPMASLMAWFKGHNWDGRIKAFDKWTSKITLAEFENALKETSKERAAKHVGIINASLELLEREINKYLDTSRNSELPGLLKPSDITKMAEVMIKLDRVIKGESTEHVKHDLDLSKLSVDELKKLNDLTSKAVTEDDRVEAPQAKVH